MRTKNTLLTALLVWISLISMAQIKATIKGAEQMPVILASYHGDQLIPVDTAVTDASGRAIFSVAALKTGQYRLVEGKGNGIDLIFNQTPVIVQSNGVCDTVHFSDSLNRDYQELQQKEQRHRRKMDLLESLIDNYPDADPFYQKVTAQYVKEQIDFSAYLNGLIRRHHATILSPIAITRKKPFLAPELSPLERKATLAEHFWDAAGATDTLLLFTNAYTRKAIEFLTLYSNPDYEKDELQASFITGINELIPHIDQQPAVFAFLMEYLINGFEQFGFEDVLQYLATVYESEGCTDEASRQRLAGKVEIIKRMAIGNKAPPLSGELPDGNQFSLFNLKEPYTLVIFWASWCPHCNEIMPPVAELYNHQTTKQLEVLAFSLDTNRKEWEVALKKQNYGWVNITELKGWKSVASDEWGIFATPTMILLGPGHTIISKPNNLNELKSKLTELGLITR